MHSLKNFLMFLLAAGACLTPAFGQVAGKVTFKEPEGGRLHLRSVVLLPAHDSMQGIYAGALQPAVKDLILEDHKLDLVEASFSSVRPASEWSKEAELLSSIFGASGADGALALGIAQRGGQLLLGLYLYHASDNKLLLKEERQMPPESTHAQLKAQLPGLYQALMKQLPYSGEVLSRTGDELTINIGSHDGAKAGDRYLAVKVLQLKRHPHFEFLMETEHEAIGSVEIIKTSERLSFARLISEVRPQSLTVGTKLVQAAGGAQLAGSEAGRLNEDFIFGQNPSEWRPAPPPAFGLLRAALGVYNSRSKTHLKNAGPRDTEGAVGPAVELGAELWLTSKWTIALGLEQVVANFENPNSLGLPGELSSTLSQYRASLLRRVYPATSYMDPSLELGLGFSKWRWSVDSATPLELTSWDLSGMFLQMRGQLPLTEAGRFYLGGDFRVHLWPSMKESPETSAAGSKNSLTEIYVFGRYAARPNWWVEAGLDFSLYSARLSGTGTLGDTSTALSHHLTGLKAAVLYLF